MNPVMVDRADLFDRSAILPVDPVGGYVPDRIDAPPAVPSSAGGRPQHR